MSIKKLLEKIKKQAQTKREQGTNFENLIKLFLENDKTYAPQFQKIQTYSEYAAHLV